MRFIYLIILFTVLSSCTSYLDIETQDVEPKVVVNCLFSEDENWKVQLNYSKNIGASEDLSIEDATVVIDTSDGESIFLTHVESGYYTIDAKPERNKRYRLTITIPGHSLITAESSLPEAFEAEFETMDLTWGKYMYPNDLYDYDVLSFKVVFPEKVEDGNFLFRAHRFKPEYGYMRYLLSSVALERLKQAGVPTKGIERLQWLTDEWHVGTQIFYDCLDGIGSIMDRNNYLNLISRELKKRKVSTREYGAFLRENCFSDDDWLSNISYDTHTVMGQGKELGEASLFYSDPNLKFAMDTERKDGTEYWVEVTRGSKEYYEYYYSYILQVSQRMNPYAEPVVVFSNIENGTGIFAGYKRKMLHLLSY